jgi:hypothetical protein
VGPDCQRVRAKGRYRFGEVPGWAVGCLSGWAEKVSWGPFTYFFCSISFLFVFSSITFAFEYQIDSKQFLKFSKNSKQQIRTIRNMFS